MIKSYSQPDLYARKSLKCPTLVIDNRAMMKVPGVRCLEVAFCDL